MRNPNLSGLRKLFDDRLLGLAGVGLGLAILWLMPTAVRASTFLLPGTDFLFIRGDFFPRVVGWGFVVIGAWLLVIAQVRRMRGTPQEAWPAERTTRGEFIAAIGFVVLVAVYVRGVNTIGFMYSTGAVFLLLSKWLGATWKVALGTAIIGALTMEVVFSGVLGIPLPGRIIRF